MCARFIETDSMLYHEFIFFCGEPQSQRRYLCHVCQEENLKFIDTYNEAIKKGLTHEEISFLMHGNGVSNEC